jgi:hypothetical protein
MRGKLVLLLILVLAFIGFVVVKFFFLNSGNAFGKLKVVTSPGSDLFVDNVAIGKTPYEEKFKVGEFMLKLIPEKTASETASWQGKIKIYKNALTYVNRELGSSDITSAGEIFTIVKMDKAPANKDQGEIYVETDPDGAIVYLDNDEKGIAPLVLADVSKGEHELAVSMPGFFRRSQKILVEAGFRVNAAYKLAIDQNQTPEATPSAQKEATTSAKTKLNFVTIKDTPTGWLRVRESPNLDASESARVKPGEKFSLLDEQTGWYKIKIATQEGWISSQYSEKTQ